MARTRKDRQSKFRGYAREAQWAKRLSSRKWKAQCRRQMRREAYDMMPVQKGTEGWITW
jgi:hypothetical protein